MSERKSPIQSATLYKIGTKKKGNDNNIWIITENKNGVKRWKLYKKKIMENPDDYFKQFPDYRKPINDISFFNLKIKTLQNELKKIGVMFYFLKWGKKSLFKFNEHIYFIENLVMKEINNYPNGYIYTSDLLLYMNSFDKKSIIYLYHNITDNAINDVNKILISNFPNRTLGIQDIIDPITINIKEEKKLVKMKEHTQWTIKFFFEDIKIIQSREELSDAINFIRKNIGKKIIHRLDDTYNEKGKSSIYFSIYNDKIDEFVEKIKKLKIDLLPKIKKIFIIEKYKPIIKKQWTLFH